MKSMAVIITIFFPTVSVAYDAEGFALLGIGSSKCSVFLQHMQEKTQAATAIYTQWQSGYISGVNSVTPGSKDFSKELDRELLLDKTMKFCAENSTESFYDATKAILFSHTQDSIFLKKKNQSRKDQQVIIIDRD